MLRVSLQAFSGALATRSAPRRRSNLAGELFGGWAPLYEVSKVHQQFLERAEERPFEREGRERGREVLGK